MPELRASVYCVGGADSLVAQALLFTTSRGAGVNAQCLFLGEKLVGHEV